MNTGLGTMLLGDMSYCCIVALENQERRTLGNLDWNGLDPEVDPEIQVMGA